RGNNQANDVLTLKYNQGGVLLWSEIFDNITGYTDFGSTITIDPFANPVVGGSTIGNEFDFLTLKYDSSGQLLWTATYDGTSSMDDLLEVLETYDDGSIYVSGGSEVNDVTFNMVTIKYESDGTEEWVSRFQGFLEGGFYQLTGMVVDDHGNVYATGWMETDTTEQDYLTVSYSPEGILRWVQQYDGPAGQNDKATAIAIDALNNVYVTGVSRGVGTGDDYATIKYSSTGQQLWVVRYDIPAPSEAVDVAVDTWGDVFVTGKSQGFGSGDDYLTVAYAPDGTQLWTARYNGLGNVPSDEPSQIVVDPSGRVAVTGKSGSDSTVFDYATVVYDQNGSQLWVRRYDGTGGRDEATDLIFDPYGNLIVAGKSQHQGGGSDWDYALVKYDMIGNVLWINRYDGPTGSDEPASVAVNDNGYVAVTGRSQGDVAYDYLTVLYSPDGQELWNARYNGPPIYPFVPVDEAWDVIFDIQGNLFVTGGSYSPGPGSTGMDIVTLRYAPDGTLTGMERYNGPGNAPDDVGLELALDRGNNLYVAGNTGDTQWNLFTLLKYSSLTPVSVPQNNNLLPEDFQLLPNYPNPFNPVTTIEFSLPHAARITLHVYDIAGRKVKTLVNGNLPAGNHTVKWDGT
ncbi:MAG: hypothetical protein D6732_17785, partial [Methanobacteriota archaeon]